MNENLNKQEREQIVELGSDITKSKKGSIYTLTTVSYTHLTLPTILRV